MAILLLCQVMGFVFDENLIGKSFKDAVRSIYEQTGNTLLALQDDKGHIMVFPHKVRRGCACTHFALH